MGLVALVMAGGRGSRMKLRFEKPLLDVGGKPMIEHIVDALKNAEEVDNVIDGTRVDEAELEQETLVVENEQLAVNVNTEEDLHIARILFRNTRQGNPSQNLRCAVVPS